MSDVGNSLDIASDKLHDYAFYEELLRCLNESNAACYDYLDFDNGLSQNDGHYGDNMLQDPSYKTVAISFCVLVIIIGTIGNLLVVLTLCSRKHKCSATDVFIVSLAVSDISLCVIDLPVSTQYQITDDWMFGALGCHIIPTVITVAAYGSTLMLMLIAIDRYILIVYPLKPRMTSRHAGFCVLAAFIVAVAIASPISIFAKYIEVDEPLLDTSFHYCIEHWPSRTQRLVYTVGTLLVQFVAPLCVVTVLYLLIFRQLKSRLASASKSAKGRRSTKMLVSVVVAFAISWTPYHIYSLMSEINPDLLRGRHFRFTDVMLRVFAMASSCINPFLYGWFNETYRTAFLTLFAKVVNLPCTRDLRSKQNETLESNVGSLRSHLSPAEPKTSPQENGRDQVDEATPLQGGRTNFARASMTSYSSSITLLQ